MMQIEKSQQLLEYYQSHSPELLDVEISALTKIAAGWESEILAFTLTHGNSTNRLSEELVLRLFPGDATGERSANEFLTIRRLNKVGYPAPHVFLYESQYSPLGMPFTVMERIYGSDMWDKLGHADANTYPKLMATFSCLVAQLHQFDWHGFVDKQAYSRYENPFAFIDHWMNMAEEGHARFPHSGLLPVLDWIQTRRDDFFCPRPAPVHNDFHPGNVLLQPNDLPMVIDWTGFDISDPRFDLGWTVMQLFAYHGDKARDYFCTNTKNFLGNGLKTWTASKFSPAFVGYLIYRYR